MKRVERIYSIRKLGSTKMDFRALTDWKIGRSASD